ncbi:RING finger protein 37 [Drosophila tropicalis]|uniref:RING finger protein 37 n=1 Tax=Drosophila tropicalis TaxID=46794 RepID=UPI0035AB82F1
MSSLINFLNPKLKPSVECDAVCEDGYTAANLIADNAEQLERGFMCFAVCKPPVEIVFDFPKAIDMKVIKLWHSSGSLRSTGFEVHGKYDGIWERVAYVRDLAKGVDSVTFCYQSDYNSRSSTSAAQQQSEKVFFFKTAHKILATTNSVKIVIRATERCPPVLRKVQIWGLPARSLDKADRELMKTIWSEISDPYGQRDQAQQPQGQRSPSRHIPELREQSSLELPEEFLDSITWELMIFPTVLPSGKVVDQSTIDKHSEEEAKWGRQPSDPFTGLEYTSQRKAILNLALKARIEKFLMEHSEHFKSVPRSLGSSRMRRRHASQFASSMCHPGQLPSSSAAGTYSTLCGVVYKQQQLHQQRKTKSTVTATATLSSTSVAFSGSSSPPAAKRARHSSSSHPTACATVTASSIHRQSPPSTSTSSSSIDQDIQQALQKITRFTQVAVSAPTSPPCCINCRSGQYAYEIRTCRHLVCRECLVLLTSSQQCVCKVSFRGADIERYHKLP